MSTKRVHGRSARSAPSAPSKNGHSTRGVSRSGSARNLLRSKALVRPQTRTAPAQRRLVVDEKHLASVRNFEAGLRYLQRENYQRARDVFEKLIATARSDVAHRSRMLLKVCVDRLRAKSPSPRTAGDYHVLGVAELNARDLDNAVEHLSKAEKLQPRSEEIRYALAAAHSLKGNADAAMEHLKEAIALRPENRFQARRDPDFHPLVGDSRFRQLFAEFTDVNSRQAS